MDHDYRASWHYMIGFLKAYDGDVSKDVLCNALDEAARHGVR